MLKIKTIGKSSIFLDFFYQTEAYFEPFLTKKTKIITNFNLLKHLIDIISNVII